MSDWTTEAVRCPACGTEQVRTLFKSLNGVLLPHYVEAIAAGLFELIECTCGHRFQPEHRMLLSHLPLGEWVVMYPWAERGDALSIEADVLTTFGREFSQPPKALEGRVETVRPRLVFGQCMLAEAVRLIGMGLDASCVEAAKLLWVRRHLAQVMAFGPALLCIEEPSLTGFTCSVRALEDGAIVGSVDLPQDTINEALTTRAQLRTFAPLLFDRPYVSAATYLYPV